MVVQRANDIGALLICSLLSFASFGVVAHQGVFYFTRFQSDRLGFKLVAIVCMMICCLDTCFDASWSWKWLVVHYGDLEAIGAVPFELPATVTLMSLTTLVVHGFYSFRIYMISGRASWTPLVILLCSVAQFSSVLFIAPYMVQHPTFEKVSGGVFPAAWVWLGGSVAADFLTTSAMVHYLHVKPKGGVNATSQGIFYRILLRAVNANALALISQIVVIALFKMPKAGFWWLITIFTICKVLTFSLFMSLNARRSILSDLDGPSGSSGKEDPNNFSLRRTITRRTGMGLSTIGNISVHVEEEVDVSEFESSAKHLAWNGDLSSRPVNIHFPPSAAISGKVHHTEV